MNTLAHHPHGGNPNQLAHHPHGGAPLASSYVWETNAFAALKSVLDKADTAEARDAAKLAYAASASNGILHRQNGVILCTPLSDTPAPARPARLEDTLRLVAQDNGLPQDTAERLSALMDAYLAAIGI